MNTLQIIDLLIQEYTDSNTIVDTTILVIRSHMFMSILDRWCQYFNQDAITVLADYVYENVQDEDTTHDLSWKLEQSVTQALIIEANLDTSLVPPEFPTE